MVLHRLPLPIAELGDIEPLGLGLWAWCTRCKLERRVTIGAALSVRPFAEARFRCTTCGSVGYPTIRPPARRRADEAVGLADIYCERCVPPWSILEVNSSRQPWNGARLCAATGVLTDARVAFALPRHFVSRLAFRCAGPPPENDSHQGKRRDRRRAHEQFDHALRTFA
ncbi:MAG: hypothetical protein JO339_30785 [Alphaproteobacteria bacterium]|nr:hypothetical protein [Alphaproteobacteria bacterium]